MTLAIIVVLAGIVNIVISIIDNNWSACTGWVCAVLWSILYFKETIQQITL